LGHRLNWARPYTPGDGSGIRVVLIRGAATLIGGVVLFGAGPHAPAMSNPPARPTGSTV
jgi:hypothetical protein